MEACREIVNDPELPSLAGRRWRKAAESGADMHRPLTAGDRQEWQKERKKQRKLEKEVVRKDKALAEAVALLALKKNGRKICGNKKDD